MITCSGAFIIQEKCLGQSLQAITTVNTCVGVAEILLHTFIDKKEMQQIAWLNTQ